MGITIGYTFISIAIVAIDLIIAGFAFSKGTKPGKCLGLACVMAVVVDCSYLITINTSNYFINSVFSSIYFAAISFLLNVLVVFVFLFTDMPRKKLAKTLISISQIYCLFEIVVFAINPFREIVISYSYRGGALSRFSYNMMPLYWTHLCYSYILIAAVLFMLIYTALRVPREYRRQYILCALALGLIVLINAVFLYIPDMGVISRIDVSVMLYSLAAVFFYWAGFAYPKRWTERILKNSIFDSLDLGIVLFGYNDQMIFYNEKVTGFIPFLDFTKPITMDEFLEECLIDFNRDLEDENYSIQWYRENEAGDQHPYFCDYKRLKNESGRNLGRILIFEDAILESDPMTGFHSLESFSAYSSHSYFEYPVVIVCCDINSLSIINHTYGRTAGDQLIRELADRYRSEFPIGTYFIRGNDARLFALCNNAKESEAISAMNRVRKTFSGTFQYAVVVATESNPDIVEAINKSEQNVAVRKLMDKDSNRFDTLNSLISALKECDKDTEAHVQRTQNMGIELSRRIGLSDSEEVKLALLCVLHDIGKIGVPLEILNKPGRLTEDEWEQMKSHVEKGYEIAMSSTDYIPIADAILHHHERWDGRGYPDGLSKESIPLLSRIITVIDAYDAMISRRPYKDALSKEQAVGELLRNAGTQFDPAIVNEFIQLLMRDEIDLNADIFNAKALLTEDEKDRPNSARFRDEDKLEGEEVHNIPYVKYFLDKDFRITKIDESFTELTGYTAEDVERLNLKQMDLVPERSRVLYTAMVQEQLAKNQMAYFEHTILRKDGSEVFVVCMGRNYFDSAVREEKSEILVFDITQTNAAIKLYRIEKEKADNRLEVWEQTFRKDSLTGLFTHSAFVNEVELKLLDKSTRTVMLMLDLDHFKEFNDTYGHRNGDEFLIVTADAIQESLRETDIAGRLGGDEFAAAMFFPTDVSDDVIRSRVQETFDSINIRVSSVENGTTLSMGAAVSGEDIGTFTALYDAADKAMYSAKNAGRNRIEW